MKPRNPEIPHSLLLQHLHYDPDTGDFSWKIESRGRNRKNGHVGHVNVFGYVKIKFAGCHVSAHRLAWFYMHGEWPAGRLDHINGIRSDNRVANLRPCNVSQNRINSKPNRNNRSGLKGAHWSSSDRKWIARCGLNGRSVRIGSYDTAEAAHQAYMEFAKRHYGEFAPTQIRAELEHAAQAHF